MRLALTISILILSLAACAGSKSSFRTQQLSTYNDQSKPEWVVNAASQRCWEKEGWFYCVETEALPYGADPIAGMDSAAVKAKARIAGYLNTSINSVEQRMSEGYGYNSKDLKQATNIASQVIGKQGIVPKGQFWALKEESSDTGTNRNYECYSMVGLDIKKASEALENSIKRVPEPKMGVSKELQVKADDLQKDLLNAAAGVD